MLGDDGRVRVIDFGLARSAEGVSHELDVGPVEPESGSGDPVLDTPLTRHGELVGTPQYMPPEQLEGGTLDARSDQFSFCVTLYEALYGLRPFEGDNSQEIGEAARAGRLSEPGDPRSVPAWLHRTVLRGLAPDRADRFADMDALLAELGRDHTRRLRRAAAGGGLLIAFAVAVLVGARSGDDGAAPCANARAELAGAWDQTARDRIAAGFAATEHPQATDTARRVGRIFDDYADAWVAMRTSACEATRLHGTQSTEALDLRTACLDRRRSQLASLVGVFADARSPEVVERAVKASLSLPPLAACEQVASLNAIDDPPDEPGMKERIAAVRADLDRVGALEAAGDYDAGLEQIGPVVDAARSTGYEPLIAEALLRSGGLLDKAGKADEAEAAWYEAASVATRSRDDRTAARAWIELMWAIGFRKARHAEAMVMYRVAEAALDRIDADAELRAHLQNTLGVVQIARGDYDAAIDNLEKALRMREELLGRDHYTIAYVLDALGLASEHAGRMDDARAHAERALAIRRDSLGPDHPDVAFALTNLGEVYLAADDLDRAESYARQALELRERQLGDDHPALGAPLGTLASVATERGNYDTAQQLLERALAIFGEAVGDDHPSIALYHSRMGELQAARGNHELALTSFARVVALLEPAVGDDHPDIAATLTSAGLSELALGRRADAVATLERALSIAEGDVVPAQVRGEAEYALARALPRSDRARRRQLATAAADRLRTAGDADQADEIDRWLAGN
jgi:tetratricopeptide (TPR) repeat protein